MSPRGRRMSPRRPGSSPGNVLACRRNFSALRGGAGGVRGAADNPWVSADESAAARFVTRQRARMPQELLRMWVLEILATSFPKFWPSRATDSKAPEATKRIGGSRIFGEESGFGVGPLLGPLHPGARRCRTQLAPGCCLSCALPPPPRVDYCGGLDSLLHTTLAIGTPERPREVCRIPLAAICPGSCDSTRRRVLEARPSTCTCSKLPDRYKNSH